MAACELVNCSSMEIQCQVRLTLCSLNLFLVSLEKYAYLCLQGVAPTISIDNTEGCQLYLSKDSLDTSITTAKSEVNVLVPASEAEGDWVRLLFSF